MYRVRIKNIAGTEIFNIPFTGFSIRESLNRGIDGTISCSYQALKEYSEKLQSSYNAMLKSEFREVQILDNDTLLYTLVLNRKQNTKNGAVTLYVSDYLAMLGTRITANDGLKYTSTDSAVIAWDEINISQTKTNGDFGIIKGLQPTTINRQRTLRYDNLLSLVVGMSNLKVKGGYDVEVDKTKTINWYFPQKGSTKTNIVFTPRNIIEWNVNEGMAGNIVNRVAVLGKGSEDDMVTSEREDITNQADWLLHEATLAEKGVSSTDELDDRGDKFLEDNDTPEDNRSITITHVDGFPVSLTDYELGDTVKVQIPEEDIDENLRVIKRTIALKNSAVKISVGFENV